MIQIQVAGGNTFQLAAQYLGDATQGIRLLQVNGLTDPFLVGVQTILIPDPESTPTDGVVAQ